MKGPRKTIKKKGRLLATTSIRFEFYDNGILMKPDKGMDPEFAELLDDTFRSVLQQKLRINPMLRRLNPFRTTRVFKGDSTEVYGLFYQDEWDKRMGLFVTIEKAYEAIQTYSQLFKAERKDPEQIDIISGTVRFII